MRVEGQVSQSVPVVAREVVIDKRVQVGADEVWIEVDLATQILYLYRGFQVHNAFRVSTGRPGIPGKKVSKATRQGVYRIYALYKSYPMWGRDGKDGWRCPDVPYVMWFHGELAIHAAYWHNDFGTPVSHGCVNMAEVDAAAVYALVKRRTVVWVHDD